MPGTPATTPRLAIPRYGDLDLADIGAIANSISDRVDMVAPLFTSGLLANRPSTGAGIVDRYYWATDTKELYRDAGGATPTWEFVTRRDEQILTALPGSPYNGQRIVYRAAIGLLWELLYDSSIVDAYKWLVLGQPPPLIDEIVTDELTTSATYTNLATVGPSVTLPLAGEYDVRVETEGYNATAGQYNVMSYAIGATAASEADSALLGQGPANNQNYGSRRRRKTGLAAGVTLTSKYRVSGGTGRFLKRSIEARPTRVG